MEIELVDDERVSPEKRLLLEVIYQAIKDAFFRPVRRSMPEHVDPVMRELRAKHQRAISSGWQLQRQQALHWLLEDRDDSRVMSLGWCCNQLGTNVEAVRERVEVTLGVKKHKPEMRFVL